MMATTIYHNPRCTKSRQAMQVATELGADVEVVKYLDTPPDAATLRSIIAKLEDPVAGGSMTHAYDVHPLPMVT